MQLHQSLTTCPITSFRELLDLKGYTINSYTCGPATHEREKNVFLKVKKKNFIIKIQTVQTIHFCNSR